MPADVLPELYGRVSTLRDDAFALIEDVHLALRDARGGHADLDLAATLATLQAVANRLGEVQASLTPAGLCQPARA